MKRFFSILVFFNLVSLLFSQKIKIINTTANNVTLKVQNEETLLFDRLTISSGATIELDSQSSRRVSVSDSVHFYTIKEIKEGHEQYSVYTLSLSVENEDDALGFEYEENESYEAEIIVENENVVTADEENAGNEETAVAAETDADADSAGEAVTSETDVDAGAAEDAAENDKKYADLEAKLNSLEEKINALEKLLSSQQVP